MGGGADCSHGDLWELWGLLGGVGEYLVTRSVVSWAGRQADGHFPVGWEIGGNTRIDT